MAKVQFELNLPGLNELMKSAEMQAVTKAAGQAMASAAGEGFESKTHVGSFTAITSVYPATADAARKNMRENTLLKATGAAGLGM